MSYIKLVCSSCNSKHEVSNYYINQNKHIDLEELAKKLCNCQHVLVVSKKKLRKNFNFIFTKKIDEIANESEIYQKRDGKEIKVFSAYKYIPHKYLNFKYLNEFHRNVKIIERNLEKTWNRKELILRFKCQKEFKKLSIWKEKFSFVDNHSIDHDNSYLLLRAFKKRDSVYLNFLAERLNNALLENEILICRIPSSKKNTKSGCDDLIKLLSNKNKNFLDGSNLIKRIKDIPKASLKKGIREPEIHLASSTIINIDRFYDKDVLLIYLHQALRWRHL